MASIVPVRSTAVEPSTQSCRVPPIIAMIARTPRPGSPIISARACSKRTSAVAFERLPSLSLSRSIVQPLSLPSGSRRGTSRQLTPSGACASTNSASECTAETNHFSPVTR
jgi:hypothetical protein